MDNVETLGIQFLHWIQQGLSDGSMQINNAQAAIHVVEQGLALVSPRIFHNYTGSQMPVTDQDSPSRLVQHAFEKMKIHQRTELSGQYTANVVNDGKVLAKLVVYVIPNNAVEVLFGKLPPVNPKVVVLE